MHDLRVQVRHLDRPRGARVQVTMIWERDQHEEKVAAMLKPDQLVVLSPFSLAGCLQAVTGSGWMPGKPAATMAKYCDRTTLEHVSRALRILFCGALSAHRLDPRGPMAQVPL